MKIPIEVSARHIHLSREDLDFLFGKDYQLKPFKQLSQPGGFAAEEKVKIEGKNGKFFNLRVIGPPREQTQIELSVTATYKLGFEVPLRESGDLKGSSGCMLIGPNNSLKLEEGVIISKRHIHINPKQAEEIGLKDGQEVSVKVDGPRGLIFNNVVIRIKESFDMSMHIDTDEGNAVGIKEKGEGEMII